MASLKDLGIQNDISNEEVDLGNLPKVGGYAPLLQPGTYRFQLPANLGNVWDKLELADGRKRLSANFDQEHPLVVIQSPENKRNGEPFQTRISNAERERGKDKIKVSDMDYLLRAVGHQGKLKLGDNTGYAQALMAHAGAQFPAKVELTWYCNDKKDIYVQDAEGNSAPVEGQKGCGTRYYMKDIEKLADGTYPERITCSCGASVRAFNQFASIG